MERFGKSSKKEKEDFGLRGFFKAVKDILDNPQFTIRYSKGKKDITEYDYTKASVGDDLNVEHTPKGETKSKVIKVDK